MRVNFWVDHPDEYPTTTVTPYTGYWDACFGWHPDDASKPIPKNWRWFDVFREWLAYRFVVLEASSAYRILRVQERLSQSVRRREKRRQWLQGLK